MKLAIVFEETGAYAYKERKRAERGESGGGSRGGLQEGFEEDFTFGEEDDNDYWDRPDILYGEPLRD